MAGARGRMRTVNTVTDMERTYRKRSDPSSELSEHLLRTAEVPVHAHSTEHANGLGEMCPRLFDLIRGRGQTRMTQVASSRLRLWFRVRLDWNGVQNRALPRRVGRTQPAQRLGQCSMSDGGAEDIAALLTERDGFPGDSARLVQLAQDQEGFGKGGLPLGKDESRADP